MLTQFVSFLGALSILFANTVGILYLGNFLNGYTNGVYLGIVPIYTSEISQPKLRKFTGSFLSITFNLGFTAVYIAGSLSHWKTAAIVQAVWPFVIFLLLIVCPDSPTWLVNKGKKDIAIGEMMKLRGNEAVAQREISRLENNISKQAQNESEASRSKYFQRQITILKRQTFLRPCLVVTIMMSIGWHWTGAYVLILHTVEIFQEFEIPIPAVWASAGVGMYQLLGGLVGIVLSWYISRRKFYIGSGVLVFIGSCMLASVVHLKRYAFFVQILEENTFTRWITLIAILIYFTGYSTGWIAVCFMLLGELLPSNGRELGSFIAVQCSNISAIIIVKTLPNLKSSLGIDGLFWLFSGASIFAMLFAYFCVPDTFGKTLEDIESHYRRICSHSDFRKNTKTDTGSYNMGYIKDQR